LHLIKKSKLQHLNKNIHYTLRIAVAMCFIGHGAFGIITKAVWCNYFAVVGISDDLSYQLMPVVGSFDILMGITMLVNPVRAIPAWLVLWGIFTALLRPLSGEPFAEFIERAGNFGASLGLLILSGMSKNGKEWFTLINPNKNVSKETYEKLSVCLRMISFLLLLGHGWLNLIGKKGVLDQYALVGFTNTEQIAQIIGIAEITAALIILIRPFRSLVFLLFLWKMISEIFYPHYKLFEWVERGGSYGVLLALWMLTEKKTFFTWMGTKITGE